MQVKLDVGMLEGLRGTVGARLNAWSDEDGVDGAGVGFGVVLGGRANGFTCCCNS